MGSFEHRERGIVCPGNPALGTRFASGTVGAGGPADEMAADYVRTMDLPREEVVRKFTAKVPLGRLARVDDLVNLICFLASDRADYMTGQSINVTRGH